MIDQFNRLCTERGPTIILIKSKEGQQVFGGYASQSWSIPYGSWMAKRDNKAFVFSLNHETKHPISHDYDNALTSFRTGSSIGAICFGGKGNSKYDICIVNNFNEAPVSWSNLGYNYALMPS